MLSSTMWTHRLKAWQMQPLPVSGRRHSVLFLWSLSFVLGSKCSGQVLSCHTFVVGAGGGSSISLCALTSAWIIWEERIAFDVWFVFILWNGWMMCLYGDVLKQCSEIPFNAWKQVHTNRHYQVSGSENCSIYWSREKLQLSCINCYTWIVPSQCSRE